jgi:hypothetical protein
MTSTDSEVLYERDFSKRSLQILLVTLIPTAVMLVLATASVLFAALAVVWFLAGGLAFAMATTQLDVRAGAVVRKTRLRERSYDASTLQLERRGTPVVLVLAPIAKPRKVVCAFTDDDPDRAVEAFCNAGVTIVVAAPKASPESP